METKVFGAFAAAGNNLDRHEKKKKKIIPLENWEFRQDSG